MRNTAFALMLLVASGCSQVDSIRWIANPNVPDKEVPTANLPGSLHQRNWVERGTGQGSCVHASTVYCLQWSGEHELAAYWHKKYAGGETARSIQEYFTREHIPFVATEEGMPWIFDYANDTRRAAIMWWKPSHCCTFVGWTMKDGVEVAVVYDNNRPGQFEYHERDEFIRKWRGYGGFAAVPVVGAPSAPIPWPSIVPESRI